jgi:hypothetical protein
MTVALSKLTRLSAAFERLSDRERKIVLAGSALVVLAGLVLAALLVSRRVNAMEEEVVASEQALADIVAAGPAYLRMREDEKAVADQLERASKEPLQAAVLGIAKAIAYDRQDQDGAVINEKLADVIKFSNASDILAELTTKTKKAVKKKTKKKGGKEVFLSTIDAVFENVPDEAIFRFMAKLETHPEPMFGLNVDINRSGNGNEQMRATIKIGQFRYGQLEE